MTVPGIAPLHHTLSVLVENKAGVLARVAGLFARRGYNIYSLAVAPTDDDRFSRITIVVDVESAPLEQITKQLFKLINVVKISELAPGEAVERELMLCTVRADPGPARSQVIELADVFEGQVIDVGHDELTLMLAGRPDKLDDFEKAPQGWSFVGGEEFPGAKGSLVLDPAAAHGGSRSYRLSADFTGGGAYVGTWRALEGRDFSEIRLWARAEGATRLGVRHETPQAILVRGGKIATVAAGAPFATAGQIIDAKGMTAMPGFIDAHRHINTGPNEKAQMQAQLEAGYTTILSGGGPAEGGDERPGQPGEGCREDECDQDCAEQNRECEREVEKQARRPCDQQPGDCRSNRHQAPEHRPTAAKLRKAQRKPTLVQN